MKFIDWGLVVRIIILIGGVELIANGVHQEKEAYILFSIFTFLGIFTLGIFVASIASIKRK